MHFLKRSFFLVLTLVFSYSCDFNTTASNKKTEPHVAENFLQSDLDSAIYYATKIDVGYLSKYILGYAYSQKKDYSRSLANYLEALDFSPNEQERSKIYNNLARLAKLYKANDAAMDYYQQALQLDEDKNNPVILYNLANVYKAIDDPQNAQRLYEVVLERSLQDQNHMKYLKCLVQLGIVNSEMQNRDKAIELFDMVINYQPQNNTKYTAKAYHNKALIENENGNIKKAINLLQKALSHHTDDANRFVTLLDLGIYNLSLDRAEKSIDYLGQAEKLYSQVNPDSEYIEVFYYMAQAKRKVGKIDEAFHYTTVYRSNSRAYMALQQEINSRLNTREFHQILENHRQEKEATQKQFWIIIIIALLMAGIVAVIFIYKWREERKKKAIVSSFEKFNASLKQT